MIHLSVEAVLLIYLFACKAPVTAPEDLDGLLNFMYVHMEDEDDEALLVGINNVFSFVAANQEALDEGYDIAPLSIPTLEIIEQSTEFREQTYGVSIAYEIPHSVEAIAECYAAVNLVEIYPDTYLSYEREFLTDQACFLSQECNLVQYRSIIQTALPFNATVTTNNMVEIRWLQTERGTAFIQRSWMEGEADSSADWANLLAQNYLEVSWTTEDGSQSLAASWAALQLGDIPVPEDTAKNLALGSIRDSREALTSYLDNQDSQ